MPVSYTSSNTNVAMVNESGVITFVAEGTTIITANQTGDATYKAATPVSQILVIKKISQTITFDPIPTQNMANATYQLNTTASSGLPVSYTSSNTNVATVNKSGVITFVAAGTTTITANQNGNEFYKAAMPVSQNLIISISNNNNPMTNMLYPNPVPANKVVSLNLENQDVTGNVTIEIYNLKGILIKTETIPAASTISFNTPSHSGIYIVKVKTKSKKRTRRLIVK